MRKKICLLLVMSLISQLSFGQSARAILDKVAATLSNKGGVTATFHMSNKGIGSVSGNISSKGRKFHAVTPQAVTWFDGKTQWTYLKRNGEVSVSSPNEAQMQAINPYSFINIYKKGYALTRREKGNNYEVTLKATGRQKIQKMVIVANKRTYTPSTIKLCQNGQWTIFTISKFRRASLSDSHFRFNAKDYPKAEVIDLR